jgi:hypothetical protein
MRTGLVLLGLSLLWVVACTTANPPDADCITNGGICFELADLPGCDHPLTDYSCNTSGGANGAGYVCCAHAYAANITADGAIVLDAPTGMPEATLDGSLDAHDAVAPHADASDAKSSADASVRQDGSSVKDATMPEDAKPEDAKADALTKG